MTCFISVIFQPVGLYIAWQVRDEKTNKFKQWWGSLAFYSHSRRLLCIPRGAQDEELPSSPGEHSNSLLMTSCTNIRFICVLRTLAWIFRLFSNCSRQECLNFYFHNVPDIDNLYSVVWFLRIFFPSSVHVVKTFFANWGIIRLILVGFADDWLQKVVRELLLERSSALKMLSRLGGIFIKFSISQQSLAFWYMYSYTCLFQNLLFEGTQLEHLVSS